MAGEALDVFISYSHRDEVLKDELVNYHLKLLQREGKINTWQDRDIEAGAEWADEIKANLEKADIVLLLITRHFLASDYCYETEMQRAVQRHDEGTARVIPIILETCGWKYSPFSQLQVLPKDGKPVTRWDDKAEAFFNVEEGIRRVVDSLNVKRRETEAAKVREAEELRQQQEAERQEQERLAEEQRQQEQAEADRQKQRQMGHDLNRVEIQIVRVNYVGRITERKTGQASIFCENLDNHIGLEMVAIPSGEFVMGARPEEEGRFDCEGPQHTVTVPSFFMGRFPVTQTQYEAVMGENPSDFKGANRPVEQVSWDDAVTFCEKLSQLTGRTYRLPSEAEWEYACRAGTTTPFCFGLTITTDLANYRGTDLEYEANTYGGNYGQGPKGSFREQTTEFGSFPPNAFGLYDMHGNVWELCQDAWHNNYTGAPTDGTAWEESGDYGRRICRGGSWVNGPPYCRSAFRMRYVTTERFSYLGFRVVCEAV